MGCYVERPEELDRIHEERIADQHVEQLVPALARQHGQCTVCTQSELVSVPGCACTGMLQHTRAYSTTQFTGRTAIQWTALHSYSGCSQRLPPCHCSEYTKRLQQRHASEQD